MNYPLIDKDFTADAVILGDGDYPVHPIAVSLLRRAKYLCCCDGAGRQYIEHGGMPNAIVGDGDSLPAEFKAQYRDIIHIVSEQDDNDLTKASRHCIAHHAKSIIYLGTTGKREDHTLGNISLIVRYMKEFGILPTLITNFGYFVPASGRGTFATFPRQQVSLFNFGCTILHGEGLQWPVSAFDSWWQGTLNEATADTVTIDGDGCYLVFRTFDKK